MGRCINTRLREHCNSFWVSPSGNLAVHCSRCLCSLMFSDTRFQGRGRQRFEREILEAIFMKKRVRRHVWVPRHAPSPKRNWHSYIPTTDRFRNQSLSAMSCCLARALGASSFLFISLQCFHTLLARFLICGSKRWRRPGHRVGVCAVH